MDQHDFKEGLEPVSDSAVFRIRLCSGFAGTSVYVSGRPDIQPRIGTCWKKVVEQLRKEYPELRSVEVEPSFTL